ncbi:hypothetical protein BU25DRAFT_112299 [Macroventuria anomochaeta]|uniref:Uncharacterized protein n=1 Tax=Macroventuria anomochaeta TaxID=301207 RepID=A0ACB6RU62_9PLEO|nr:uncharacterized protein BU25DRAFT_112299 [Macroventuria anomochaeta]KAF2625441.1 hypothetical protein BU25DRAFT_112299 [Macroventuria anomochaeta]
MLVVLSCLVHSSSAPSGIQRVLPRSNTSRVGKPRQPSRREISKSKYNTFIFVYFYQIVPSSPFTTSRGINDRPGGLVV